MKKNIFLKEVLWKKLLTLKLKILKNNIFIKILNYLWLNIKDENWRCVVLGLWLKYSINFLCYITDNNWIKTIWVLCIGFLNSCTLKDLSSNQPVQRESKDDNLIFHLRFIRSIWGFISSLQRNVLYWTNFFNGSGLKI